ncbi:hypothetical protein [Vandammella animalimorsus]|nr:hypothetical protein [Vandammella animalimorsus]
MPVQPGMGWVMTGRAQALQALSAGHVNGDRDAAFPHRAGLGVSMREWA